MSLSPRNTLSTQKLASNVYMTSPHLRLRCKIVYLGEWKRMILKALQEMLRPPKYYYEASVLEARLDTVVYRKLSPSRKHYNSSPCREGPHPPEEKGSNQDRVVDVNVKKMEGKNVGVGTRPWLRR